MFCSIDREKSVIMKVNKRWCKSLKTQHLLPLSRTYRLIWSLTPLMKTWNIGSWPRSCWLCLSSRCRWTSSLAEVIAMLSLEACDSVSPHYKKAIHDPASESNQCQTGMKPWNKNPSRVSFLLSILNCQSKIERWTHYLFIFFNLVKKKIEKNMPGFHISILG